MTGTRLLVGLLALALTACSATPTPTEAPVEAPTETSVPSLSPTDPPTEAPTSEPTENLEPTATAEPDPTPTPTENPPTPEPTVPPFEPVIGLELVAEGLTAPVDMAVAGDGSGRLFVVDQIGLVRVLSPDGELLDEPFLDIRDRMVSLNPGYDERGLLGLAFHPAYEQTGLFAVYYSAPLQEGGPSGWDHTSHLSWFSVSDDEPTRALPDSELSILRVDQPQSNHNGGQIAFGPDDFLYVALGDGGGANDVGTGHVEDWYEANRGGNGQDVSENLLGSILRINPETSGSYRIPEDNPFAGEDVDGLDEIWTYGFRNPYRFSFDAEGERELFVADVGQNLWEEVSIATQGRNFGWNVKEGSHCFSTAAPYNPPATCPDTAPGQEILIDPIIEYRNGSPPEGLGVAVVGGYVYRGPALPAFQGRYIFGDWSTSFGAPNGSLFVATPPESEAGSWSFEELEVATGDGGRLGGYVLGFGQDADNELYVLTSQMQGPTGNTGKVWRIVPAP